MGNNFEYLRSLEDMTDVVCEEITAEFEKRGAKMTGTELKQLVSELQDKLDVAGLPWSVVLQAKPEPRFVKAASGVILDTKTHLEWYVGPDQDTTWDAAKSWTDSLTVDGGCWRMPTIEELSSIYQIDKVGRNMDAAFAMTGWLVWGEEVDGSSARCFSFYSGRDASDTRSYDNSYRGFAVRSRCQTRR